MDISIHGIIYVCFLLSLCEKGDCYLLSAMATATGLIGGLVYKYQCNFKECCTDENVPFDLKKLQIKLENDLFGQPLAQQIIPILRAHEAARDRNYHKALAISFHGWPGTGKNHVANLIAESLYKNPKSKFIKWYFGRSSFPATLPDHHHKVKLDTEIKAIVRQCNRALIIFDEVNDIPPGILDALKPMLDYRSEYDGINFGQVIFLFLSNLHGNEITNRFIELNKPRADLQFTDFDEIIRKGIYEQQGGFQNSRLVFAHLIDHFVPFLPLEQIHIEKCITQELKSWGMVNINREHIEYAMKVITYGPKSNPIFSNSGCKRIKGQVAFIVHNLQDKYKSKKEL